MAELPFRERGFELVDQAANQRLVLHGTSSSQNTDQITTTGLLVETGRATVSANIKHALSWATDQQRHEQYSKSANTSDGIGAVVVLEIPDSLETGFGTLTSIRINEETKTISRDSLKYIGGLKQLGIYPKNRCHEVQAELDTNKMSNAENKQGEIIQLPTTSCSRVLQPQPELLDQLVTFENQIKQGILPDINGLIILIEEAYADVLTKEETNTLVYGTYESMLVSRVRSLFIKRLIAEGYTVFNKQVDVTDQLRTTNERLNADCRAMHTIEGRDLPSQLEWTVEYCHGVLNS
jgi:hypothetical protein